MTDPGGTVTDASIGNVLLPTRTAASPLFPSNLSSG